MPILKDRMTLAHKEANNIESESVNVDNETIKFIDSLEKQIVSMCAIKSGAENIPKHQMMNVPKLAKIEDIIKWLNRERVPFEIITEYSNGTKVAHVVKFVTKNILSVIGK